MDSSSPPSTPASRQDPHVLEYARQLREHDSKTGQDRPAPRAIPGMDTSTPTPPDAHAQPPLVDNEPLADLPAVDAQPKPKEPSADRARGVYLLGLMARLFRIGAGVMLFVAIASVAMALFDVALGAAVGALILFIFGKLVGRRGSEEELERHTRLGN